MLPPIPRRADEWDFGIGEYWNMGVKPEFRDRSAIGTGRAEYCPFRCRFHAFAFEPSCLGRPFPVNLDP
jgi:hypothetical protein